MNMTQSEWMTKQNEADLNIKETPLYGAIIAGV
jgi:hypothetical protein